MKKKIFAACLVICLLATAVIGTTLAYFTDETDAVTNTFTVGKVKIDLTETPSGDNHEYKMIPGTNLTKDPKVIVKDGSEDCYVFVKVVASEGLENYITYSVDSRWTKLDGVDNVYYREATNVTGADAEYPVLTGNTVTVLNTVTEITGTQPTLTFTAYAIQKASFEGNPTGAWAAGSWN